MIEFDHSARELLINLKGAKAIGVSASAAVPADADKTNNAPSSTAHQSGFGANRPNRLNDVRSSG